MYEATSSATWDSSTWEPCFLLSDTIWVVNSPAIACWTLRSAAAGAVSAA
ncbi:Uncharacterised protein [Mycobacteroides abscessus subsp. abscessus]|nr:Uncharacterised protein [Mycobacteroides abscessus subsp. abscessus]